MRSCWGGSGRVRLFRTAGKSNREPREERGETQAFFQTTKATRVTMAMMKSCRPYTTEVQDSFALRSTTPSALVNIILEDNLHDKMLYKLPMAPKRYYSPTTKPFFMTLGARLLHQLLSTLQSVFRSLLQLRLLDFGRILAKMRHFCKVAGQMLNYIT